MERSEFQTWFDEEHAALRKMSFKSARMPRVDPDDLFQETCLEALERARSNRELPRSPESEKKDFKLWNLVRTVATRIWRHADRETRAQREYHREMQSRRFAEATNTSMPFDAAQSLFEELRRMEPLRTIKCIEYFKGKETRKMNDDERQQQHRNIVALKKTLSEIRTIVEANLPLILAIGFVLLCAAKAFARQN
jgi:DNA-directed RNA polymerase specialized sigma24 family protein